MKKNDIKTGYQPLKSNIDSDSIYVWNNMMCDHVKMEEIWKIYLKGIWLVVTKKRAVAFFPKQNRVTIFEKLY
jgi:hypothetical protein